MLEYYSEVSLFSSQQVVLWSLNDQSTTTPKLRQLCGPSGDNGPLATSRAEGVSKFGRETVKRSTITILLLKLNLLCRK